MQKRREKVLVYSTEARPVQVILIIIFFLIYTTDEHEL